MGTKLMDHRAGPCAAREGSVQSLVRRLVVQANHARNRTGDAERSRDPKDGIILETEVDGIKCVILRSTKPTPPPVSLSPRELEIARMIAKGHPNKTIAAVLEISSWTVGTHLRRMFLKLGVSSRAAMVARVMETGVLGRV